MRETDKLVEIIEPHVLIWNCPCNSNIHHGHIKTVNKEITRIIIEAGNIPRIGEKIKLCDKIYCVKDVCRNFHTYYSNENDPANITITINTINHKVDHPGSPCITDEDQIKIDKYIKSIYEREGLKYD